MSSCSKKSASCGNRDAPHSSFTETSWEDRLFHAINRGDARSVQTLLTKGVNVNATHPSGRTPLGTAAHLGNVEILKMLLGPSPHSLSKNNYLNFSKKPKPDEREAETWYGSSSSQSKKNSLLSMDKKLSTKCNDMNASKNYRSSLRRDSLSSDDEMPDEVLKCNRTYKMFSRAKDKTENASENLMEIVENKLSSEVLQRPCDILCGSEVIKDKLGYKTREEPNQGYFIVVHNDKSEEETKRPVCGDCSNEPMTPDDMDNLEWDSELEPEKFDSPCDDAENSDSWVNLYRWYADYLAKSCTVDMSVQQGTCLQIDVNQLDMYRRSAMHYAAEQGNMEVLHVLISAGCSVDVGDSDDVTPLHLAAARDNPDAVALLISCGAKVNRKSIDGTGPLHMAAARGFIETATILLQHGASVNSLDRSDRTPLLLAVSRGLEEMVTLLISHGAKVNVEDILGYTPLCQAVWQQEKEIVRVLLAAGAKLTHSDRLLHCAILHRRPDIAELLISAGSIVNLRDDSGDTPLIIASRSGQVNMVNLLLHSGAMASYPNGLTGSTPLHEAVECLRPAQFLVLKEVLLSLLNYRGPNGILNHGADVNILQRHTPIVSEDYLRKRPSRFVIAHLMVYAGLNLWNCIHDVKKPGECLNYSPASWIASLKFNPMSLSGLCRLRFRQHHGENIYRAVLKSGLPSRLKQFIMLEDIVRVEDFCLDSYCRVDAN
ncbi:ankyrin repeat and protein kinase domain-containing protein 1-like isoform X2 [Thrips palmi]|uniref:Ankyrin repeat and protein kinase domain-containing protein 1-like isoform X2 n=1 Tax=Thrips palmi TaxID=161013 RepID=A0A6P8YGC3_THRPL|nr:ankyrin repeat and protein kinase domain-containing protein 1-like isoform X2 [Thrips palmi]